MLSARAVARGLDPVIFARSVGLEPDEWQVRALRQRQKRVLLNCCRQSGKSTTVSVRAAHRAIYSPRSLILAISPSFRQSSELFDKIGACLRKSDDCPEFLEDNKTSCELANGSRIVSLPGNEDTIRGFSAPSMVLIDEGAFVTPAVYASVRPMLAVSNGELWILSTPHGRTGEFFELWENGGNEWHRERVTADQCPRITEEFLAAERRTVPEWLMRQEYYCEFADTVASVFSHEQVESAFDAEVLPLFDEPLFGT
jgi:hypothetical protein